jgi:hypothetical protein
MKETAAAVVYEPFMARDLTRDHVRAVIELGLKEARGDYRNLSTAFNIPPSDRKRFLHFVRLLSRKSDRTTALGRRAMNPEQRRVDGQCPTALKR